MPKYTLDFETKTLPSYAWNDHLSNPYLPTIKPIKVAKSAPKAKKSAKKTPKSAAQKPMLTAWDEYCHLMQKMGYWHKTSSNVITPYVQKKNSGTDHLDQNLDLKAPEVSVPTPNPAPISAPKPAPIKPKAKTIKDLVADPHPHFLMGIEFEGLIRSSVRDVFETNMYDLGLDEDGVSQIQFGTDSSIKLIPPGFESVEIRTSTLPIDECIVLFEQMLCMFYLASKTGDFKTNKTCGLHINISEPNVFDGKQVSLYCHILKAFDEKDILELWDRAGKKHCKPFFGPNDDKTLTAIEQKYLGLKKYEQKINREYGDEHWVNEINMAKASKYYSVALRDTPTHTSYKGPKAKDHRIEFRCIGNTNYHLRHEDLDASINHMLEIVNTSFYDIQST